MYVKLQDAVRALRANPERSVKAVAYELGYGDPRNLSRAMRRHLGINPHELRLSGHGAKLSGEGRAAGHGLFMMNRHILPPDIPDDWLARYYGPKRAAQIVKSAAWSFPKRQ